MTLQKWKLELWPGYKTAIRQHEQEILLNADISNKIIRTDSVLDQMSAALKNVGLLKHGNNRGNLT